MAQGSMHAPNPGQNPPNTQQPAQQPAQQPMQQNDIMTLQQILQRLAAHTIVPKAPPWLPIYKGLPYENLALWLFQVDGLFFGWSNGEVRKLATVSSGMEGAALMWYYGKMAPTATITTWEEFKVAIKAEF